MGAPKSAVTKAIAEERGKAQDLDLRRQRQIANQVEIIDRLMDGGTFAGEMERLVVTLSDTQVRLAQAEAEISRLQAEKG